jgi:hypothetical protein
VSPRRWGTNTRAWAYRYLVARDGEACSICHAIPTTQNPTTQNTLDIDHIDGNPNNNDPDNLRLLCRHCNVTISNTSRSSNQLSSAKRERETKEGKAATRIARLDCHYREGSPEMQANYLYEVPFRRWLMRKVAMTGGYDKQTAIAEGAELFGCSPLTTARYLTKLTSPAGPLIETQDALGHRYLILKPHLSQPQKNPPKLEKLDTHPFESV